jgi:hypothetical protein
VNAGKVNFGLLLIVVGIAALAVNVDAMYWTVYLDLLELWPLFLIVLGLQLVLKRIWAPLAYISCLLAAVAGFWVLYENYGVYGISDGDKLWSLPMSKLDEGVTRLAVDIHGSNGELTISSSPHDLIACYHGGLAGRPVVKYETHRDVARLSVKTESYFDIASYDEGYRLSDWSIMLHNGLPVSLKLDCSDTDLRLRLADFRLEELITKSRYSDIDVRFGDLVHDVKATMRVDRSDVRIKLPDSAGVEVLNSRKLNNSIAGGIGFVDDGDRLVTEEFDSAAVRFSFDFAGAARRIRISYY